MTASTLDVALRAASAGISIFPCEPGAKTPLGTGHGPLRWGGAATTNVSIIRQWWQACPNANIGVACAPSGLIVVDCDAGKESSPLPARLRVEGVNDGEDAFAEMTIQLGVRFPFNTMTVDTPSGGCHYYFRNPPGVRMSQRSPVPGWIDIRSNGGRDGGYVLGPGSVVNGRPYKVRMRAPVLPAPAWLVELFREPERPEPTLRQPAADGPFRQPSSKPTSGVLDTVRFAVEGNRNNAMHWAACALAKDGVPLAEAIDLIREAAAHHKGVTDREIEMTVKSGYRTVGVNA